MKIEHDGVHWSGTFSVLLRAFVEDMLSDGTFEATVTYIGFADRDSEIGVTVVGISDSHLLIAGSRPDLRLEDVLAIEV